MSEEKATKNKKVNKMTVAEIESALKKSEEHMKGGSSKYVAHLLARKAQLSK